jgi:uncharacterized protein YqjF (DUF2071 family)
MDHAGPVCRPFLTAQWTNLILANYAVPDALVLPYLPPGLALDRYQGRAFVSVVAFDFVDTRVVGIPWPGYRNFPEVNLRFYVRRGADRGVCFIRELVPLKLVAWLARLTYNEPYAVARMTSVVANGQDTVTVEHRLARNGRECTLRATGTKPAFRPDDSSREAFFKEHRWGFGRSRLGAATRFEVRHPVWDVYPVQDYHIDVDWAALYGPEWAVPETSAPDSVMLAAGSEVAVYPRGSWKCRAG